MNRSVFSQIPGELEVGLWQPHLVGFLGLSMLNSKKLPSGLRSDAPVCSFAGLHAAGPTACDALQSSLE